MTLPPGLYFPAPGGAAPVATILLVAPLFEEANRMRRTLALAMRALAAEGFAACLPDLPGQNDSPVATEVVDLDIWRSALAEVAAGLTGPVIVASVRGGALIDDAVIGARGWWRLAPVGGEALLRVMLRTRVAADREAGKESSIEALREAGRSATLLLAGNRLNPLMLDGLESAQPAPVAPLRSVKLGEGDGAITGTPLWLRAEPGEDATMARAMACDIAAWSRSCVAR